MERGAQGYAGSGESQMTDTDLEVQWRAEFERVGQGAVRREEQRCGGIEQYFKLTGSENETRWRKNLPTTRRPRGPACPSVRKRQRMTLRTNDGHGSETLWLCHLDW